MAVVITSPSTDDRVLVGETVQINATGIATANIYLSFDDGESYPVTVATGASLPYNWSPASDQLGEDVILLVANPANESDFDTVTITVATTFAGGLTTQQATWLEAIYNQTQLLSSSRRPVVVSPVAEGGVLKITQGVSYTVALSNQIVIQITDTGGATRTLMEAADRLSFAAGRKGYGAEVVGTVQSTSYASNVTTINIELAGSQTADKIASDDWEYQVFRHVGTGDSELDVEVLRDLMWLRETHGS